MLSRPHIFTAGLLMLMLCPLQVRAGPEDGDGDGVPDASDICPNTPQGIAVDTLGRPIGDLDRDCDTDIEDFAAFGLGFTGPLEPVGSDAGPGDLAIVEVMQNPAAVDDPAGEWFEIINVTARPIALAGLTFADEGTDGFTIPMSDATSIASGARLVFGRNSDVGSNGGVVVDYVYSSMSLTNGSDEIIIRNHNVVVDEIAWDGSPVWPDPNGASMSLSGDLDPSIEDNNVGRNWCVSVTPFGIGDLGTPGAANDVCLLGPAPGELVIVEVMQNPSSVRDGAGEWFEIINVADRAVDLAGLTFTDSGTNSFTIPAGTVVPLPPGNRFVLGVNGYFETNGGVVVDYEYSSFTLGNADDEIIISKGEVIIDQIAWDGGVTWPDPNGASMSLSANLNPAFADNNVGTNWCPSVTPFGMGDLGTPGAENDTCP